MVLRLLCVVCHSLSVAGACIKDEEEKLEENSHIYDRARVLELLQEQFVHILQERPICSMGGDPAPVVHQNQATVLSLARHMPLLLLFSLPFPSSLCQASALVPVASAILLSYTSHQ
eukprot:scaffold18357_cov21-Tisochrysis_lutea.AAC.2